MQRMKCERTSDGRACDHRTLQVMRQQAVKAVREGQTVQSVAAIYGVNERSEFRWLARFADGGRNALLARPIPGRPSKVSPEQMARIARVVRDHTPRQFEFESGLRSYCHVVGPGRQGRDAGRGGDRQTRFGEHAVGGECARRFALHAARWPGQRRRLPGISQATDDRCQSLRMADRRWSFASQGPKDNSLCGKH